MNVSKIFSKKSFSLIFIFALVMSAIINTGVYYLLKWLSFSLQLNAGEESILNDAPEIVNRLGWIIKYLYIGIIPSITVFFVLSGLFLWLILKVSAVNLFQQIQAEKQTNGSKGKGKTDFVDHKIEQDRKKRLFLHSLSVLQREGRLLDFFAEDLNQFEDDQIGAAVRSIQEDCKRAVKKYIDPKPVIEKEEGESITIESGFDIDSITLVGKVSGSPPFKGILKHRGWKAGKSEIPKLSDIQDASVIIPAEVEIQ